MHMNDLCRPLMRHFRRRRMESFVRDFRITDATSILDVGGTPMNWELVDVRPRIVIANYGISAWERRNLKWTRPNIRVVIADGTRLPFADGEFDVCFSNSVIEHVGDWPACERFAAELRRVAKRYFVQTPNRRFWIEPHLATPFLHWLPMHLQLRLVRHLTVWGWVQRPTPGEARAFLESIRLLDEREMRALFPDATIRHERWLGGTKSLMAVGPPGAGAAMMASEQEMELS